MIQFGVGIWKRTDENRIRYAEHRRVRADANAKRKCGGESHKLVAAYAAEA
jgi:hypothetical protein